MMILFLCGVALNLLSVVGMAAAGDEPEQIVSPLLGMILPAIFALVSWNAYAAIPAWLSQPAWCQELIVKSGL